MGLTVWADTFDRIMTVFLPVVVKLASFACNTTHRFNLTLHSHLSKDLCVLPRPMAERDLLVLVLRLHAIMQPLSWVTQYV